MNPLLTFAILLLYFGGIMLISYLSSRKSNSDDFYKVKKKAPWWVISIGMIGTTLSGVTFISVPGWVTSAAKMTYFEVILGNFCGYLAIMYFLLPLYYKMNLTSIYGYIQERFGQGGYKTAAWLFLLSKSVGAAFRLFIVTLVLQITLFQPLNLPYVFNVLICVSVIWFYTRKGGIQSIIWTDLIQTFFLVFAVIFTIFSIKESLGWSLTQLSSAIVDHPQFHIFEFGDFWTNKNNFFKQFISGAFITIVMTGLDQDMIQKNLCLSNIKEAKKNFLSFSLAFVPVNFLFMSMGVLFAIYMQQNGIQAPAKTDEIYPLLATQYLSLATGVFFIIGVTASAFTSANSALVAMTTSYMIDIHRSKGKTENQLKQTRAKVHLVNATVLAFIILLFEWLNNQSVVEAIFKFAGYTYGPLLGLFAMGMFSKIKIKDRYIVAVCVASIVLTVLTDKFSHQLLFGYQFGFEILLVNGLLTCVGLWLIRQKASSIEPTLPTDK